MRSCPRSTIDSRPPRPRCATCGVTATITDWPYVWAGLNRGRDLSGSRSLPGDDSPEARSCSNG